MNIKIVLLAALIGSTSSVLSQPTPRIFAEGIISDNGIFGLSFSPDSKEAYFVKSGGRRDTMYIMMSEQKNGSWQKPFIASFSGRKGIKDIDPFVSPDGKTLVFNSNRTRPADTSKHDFNIWVSYRTKDAWTAPSYLGDNINSDSVDAYATMAKNGNIYFGSNRAGGFGKMDIYVSYYKNGQYQKPVNLGQAINTSENEGNPYISPGEDFLIFNAAYAGQFGESDLYISFNTKNVWSKPLNLGSNINSDISEFCPFMVPGKSVLYFCRLKRTNPFTENAWSVNIDIGKLKKLSGK